MADELNIDFGALRQKASEMMDAAEATRTATPTPDPTPAAAPVEASAPEGADPTKVRVPAAGTPDKAEEPVAETPTVATPEVPAKTADLTDDTLVKVVVDGEEVVMPWKDARAGISRTQKFTKSMQQLAEERRQVEAQKGELATLNQLREERQKLDAFLSSPQAVANYLLQAFPQQFAQPQATPAANGDEIITRAEAQQIANQQMSAAMQQVQAQAQAQLQAMDAKIVNSQHELEHRQQTAKHAVVINSTLSQIFTDNPVLKAIPNAEDLIRFEVAKMRPSTEADALDAFRTVAQGMAEELGKHFTATKKVQAVAEAKARLVTKTIEPAGGASPQIQPVSFKDANGQVNWNKVRDMARNFGS